MAQSGLARLTGGQKVAGSNPVAPTLVGLRTVFCEQLPSGHGAVWFSAFDWGSIGRWFESSCPDFVFNLPS